MAIVRRFISLCGMLLVASSLPCAVAAVPEKNASRPLRKTEKSADDKQLWAETYDGKELPADYVARIEKDARNGDANAQAILGFIYHLGRGVKQDFKKAAEWTRKAAAQGHAGAENNMGLLYDSGVGVERDRAQAHALYLASARKGTAMAQFNVALNFANGTVVKQDYKEAAVWYEKAAEQGHLFAANNLGNLYLLGHGTPIDLPKAGEILRKPAEAGIPTSQFGYGTALLQQGKDEDGIVWIRRGAEGGYVPGMYAYGMILWEGKLLPRDAVESIKWVKKSALNGFPEAQAMMAFVQVEDTKADPVDTMRWARLAAEQGSARGQHLLGICYHRGIGVEQNVAMAATWYRRAAEGREPNAALSLGSLRESGKGVARDYAEAARWYRQAAEAGLGLAQYRLGIFHLYGTGVDANLVDASKWLKLALKQLNDPAVRDALLEVEQRASKGPGAEAHQVFLKGLELARVAEQTNESFAEAVTHLEKAAGAGHAYAVATLTGIYRSGKKGVPPNPERSELLLASIANHSDPNVLYYVGMGMLDKREQTPAEEVARANVYLLKSANQGHPAAQNAIGYSLMASNGERNPVEAFKWLSLAAQNGVPEAKVNMERLRPTLTPEQISVALRLASTFQPVAGASPK